MILQIIFFALAHLIVGATIGRPFSQIMQRGKIGAVFKVCVLVILWKYTYTRTSDARPYGCGVIQCTSAITIIANITGRVMAKTTI